MYINIVKAYLLKEIKWAKKNKGIINWYINKWFSENIILAVF